MTEAANTNIRSSDPINRSITVLYTNHRGETAKRDLLPRYVWFGKTEWHPEAQWLLHAWCFEKEAYRDFAMAGFHEWKPNGI